MTRVREAITTFFARSRIGIAGYALLAYVMGLALVSLVAGKGRVGAVVVAVGSMLVPAAAAGFCRRALKSESESRAQWAWRMFAAAFLVSAAGRALHAYYVALDPAAEAAPTSADAVSFLFYPLALVGVLFAARRGSGTWRSLTSLLDGLIFTLGVAGLWWWVLFDAAAPGWDAALAAAVVIASPAGDILILFALASLYLGSEFGRLTASVLFLLLGFFVAVAGNLAHTGWILTGGSQLRHWDVLWALAVAIMSLSALAAVRTRGRVGVGSASDRLASMRSSGRTRHLWMILPYLAFPAAAWLLYLASHDEGDGYSRFVIVLALALLGLVMVRQFVTLLENHRLSRSLVDLSRELEQRVAVRTEELTERTEQLDILNHVATALSRCLTADAVLTAGIDLALEASNSRGGVVWLLDGDRAYIAGQQGLEESSLKALRTLAGEHCGVHDGVRGTVPVHFSGAQLGWPADSEVGPSVSVLVVPLVSRSVVLGALGLVADENRPLDKDNLLLLQSIGIQLGVVLENARQYDTARYLADRDSVTGLFNHRSLHERLEHEIKRAQRSGAQFALVMMDLDNFKLFNDTYGHPVGDEVLREVAQYLAEAMRSSDVVGRYGGDEFMMLLPDTDAEGAVDFGERLRQTLHEHPFVAPNDQLVPIRLSFGVATYPDDGRRSGDLVSFADANLYLSKQHGGDRITVGDDGGAPYPEHAGMYDMLEGLITAVDSKDRYTRRHSDAVTAYALDVAVRLALSDEEARTLRFAGLLHDVGNIGIPDRILRKPGRLTVEEFEVVKGHPLLSELIVKEVPNLEEVIAAVGSHHERFDGTGYPRGLKGEEIPLFGRILAVCDAFSAMTSDRPYREAMTRDEACRELRAAAGTQLDPRIVAEFLATLGAGQVPLAEAR